VGGTSCTTRAASSAVAGSPLALPVRKAVVETCGSGAA